MSENSVCHFRKKKLWRIKSKQLFQIHSNNWHLNTMSFDNLNHIGRLWTWNTWGAEPTTLKNHNFMIYQILTWCNCVPTYSQYWALFVTSFDWFKLKKETSQNISVISHFFSGNNMNGPAAIHFWQWRNQNLNNSFVEWRINPYSKRMKRRIKVLCEMNSRINILGLF